MIDSATRRNQRRLRERIEAEMHPAARARREADEKLTKVAVRRNFKKIPEQTRD